MQWSTDDILEIEFELYRMNNLHRWLTWEGYGPLLFGGGFFLPVGIVGAVALGAAVIAWPLFTKWLYELKRYGWMISLQVFSIVPGVVAYMLAETQVLIMVVLASLPGFYIYVWALRMAVENWRSHYTAQLELLSERDHDWR
jgi:hypothetical protein